MSIDAVISGVPLVLVVLGLVEWVKRLGIEGRVLLIVSMAIGLVCGAAYQLSVEMPASLAGWVGVAAYGIAVGLVASGVYDAMKNAAGRG